MGGRVTMGLLSSKDENVFGYLDAVRARPGMYIGASKDPLRELEALIHRYYGSLRAHGLIEPVPQMANHFSTWLYCQTQWSNFNGVGSRHRKPLTSRRGACEFFPQLAPKLHVPASSR